MAALLETDEGKHEGKQGIDAETEQWLKDKKLSQLVAKFQSDDISLGDLQLFTLDDIEGFVTDLEPLTTILKVRLRAGLKDVINGHAKRKQKDKWDVESLLEWTQANELIHGKVDGQTRTVTMRNESSGEFQAGIRGTQFVELGDVRTWKLKVVRIAKQSRYFEAYIFAKVMRYSQDGTCLQYGGIVLNGTNVYRQSDITRNICEGDEISLALDLVKGRVTVRVNGQHQMLLWQWSKMDKNLRYRLHFNVDCSADDWMVQMM